MQVSQGLVVRVIQEINDPTDRRLACPKYTWTGETPILRD
jgi:hypothetical protein